MQAERDRYEREKQAREELESEKRVLEERVRQLEEEAHRAIQAKVCRLLHRWLDT